MASAVRTLRWAMGRTPGKEAHQAASRTSCVMEGAPSVERVTPAGTISSSETAPDDNARTSFMFESGTPFVFHCDTAAAVMPK